jgi:hypothetical protein
MTFRARTLWLFGLTSLLGLGAGCGGDGGDARISVAWDVAYVGGAPAGCENAGTPIVRLEATSNSAHKYTFDFNCGLLSGVSDFLPPGSYDVRLSLLDSKNRPVAKTDGNFDIRRRGINELNAVQFRVQAMQLSWLLVVQAGNGAMSTPSCAQVGVKTVQFSAHLATDAPADSDVFQFDCLENPGLGVTTAMRTGNYSYQFTLLDAANKPLTQSDIKSVVIADGADAPLTMVPPERFAFQ